MGDIQGEPEIVRLYGVKDPRQLFDRDAEVGDLRLLVDLVHVLDADGEPVLLRKLDDGRVGLDQTVEDMVHEEAEVVAEMEYHVLGLQLVGKLDVSQQVLLNGLADGRLDLGGIDERRRMEAVLDAGLIPQPLDAAILSGFHLSRKLFGLLQLSSIQGKPFSFAKAKYSSIGCGPALKHSFMVHTPFRNNCRSDFVIRRSVNQRSAQKQVHLPGSRAARKQVHFASNRGNGDSTSVPIFF